jgi:hypothetical protein
VATRARIPTLICWRHSMMPDPLSLLDVIRIENQISDLLGHAVDLIEEGTLKPRVRQAGSRGDACLLETRVSVSWISSRVSSESNSSQKGFDAKTLADNDQVIFAVKYALMIIKRGDHQAWRHSR